MKRTLVRGRQAGRPHQEELGGTPWVGAIMAAILALALSGPILQPHPATAHTPAPRPATYLVSQGGK